VGGWTLAGTYEWQPGGLLNFGTVTNGVVTGNFFYYGDPNNIKVDNPTFDHYINTAGCVASSPGPGDTVVAAGQPCTQGWDTTCIQLSGAHLQMRGFAGRFHAMERQLKPHDSRFAELDRRLSQPCVQGWPAATTVSPGPGLEATQPAVLM